MYKFFSLIIFVNYNVYNPPQIIGLVRRLATIFEATSAPNSLSLARIPGRAFCKSLPASATTDFNSFIWRPVKSSLIASINNYSQRLFLTLRLAICIIVRYIHISFCIALCSRFCNKYWIWQ